MWIYVSPSPTYGIHTLGVTSPCKTITSIFRVPTTHQEPSHFTGGTLRLKDTVCPKLHTCEYHRWDSTQVGLPDFNEYRKSRSSSSPWGKIRKGWDEMAGWHHGLDGHEFEWTPGVGDGQGGLACCNSWGRKESDTAERLNWTELGEMADMAQTSRFQGKKNVYIWHIPLFLLNNPTNWFCFCVPIIPICVQLFKNKIKTGAFVILHLCWFLTLLSDSAGSGQNTSSSFSISSLRRIPLFTGQRETLGGILGLPSSLAIFPAGLTTAFKNEHDDHLQYWEGKGED